MSKLINIIVEYNKLTEADKALFKQVIGIQSEEKSKKDMSDFLKKMFEESAKKPHEKRDTRINDIIRPYDLIRPWDLNRPTQIFGTFHNASN